MPTAAAQRSAAARSRRAKPPGSLRLYHAKRNLAVSGEPAGRETKSVATVVRQFVIQKHDATRLHYDFRLEMEGVLRSWAVPKGLPTKAGERVLAVEVEDHPIEYGKFEGTIPKGNYGGGTVMLWDRGNYTVADGTPEAAYRKGKIHLALSGEKCVGEWTLVRMHPRAGEKKTNWLLIKNGGPAHRAPLTGKARDHSVSSGRTLEEIASGRKSAKKSPPSKPSAAKPKKKEPGTRSGARPRVKGPRASAEFITPMKALSVDAVPAGRWQLEVKFDGYRAIAVINDGAIDLWSRNRKPLSDYPEVMAAVKTLACTDAVLDGEIVALDAEGRSRFQLLQGRGISHARPTIVYYVFDLLHLDGRSLLGEPIETRRKALEGLVGKGDRVLRLSPLFDLTPTALLSAVTEQRLEGIIAKKPGSRYEPDQRSGTWLKCKVHGEQEFVIAGFTRPKNSRPYFGAILVGFYKGNNLLYAGKVGSGFDHARLKSLHDQFQARRIEGCPFSNLPTARTSRFGGGMTAGAMREVTWIKPELVGQVRFTEWTDDGMLRHPVFLGLRHDKAARDVVREASPVKAKRGH